jgi:hypothetical protein
MSARARWALAFLVPCLAALLLSLLLRWAGVTDYFRGIAQGAFQVSMMQVGFAWAQRAEVSE